MISALRCQPLQQTLMTVRPALVKSIHPSVDPAIKRLEPITEKLESYESQHSVIVTRKVEWKEKEFISVCVSNRKWGNANHARKISEVEQRICLERYRRVSEPTEWSQDVEN
ncbi:hypothetical protein TNIN_92751 [Trichonephila inaurata madagascariensis]|uniref:Uncharacterized protein n=1 Tax=Trichonephila inaurata madagascariensis TaxID=2747483 RepID=A0A8X6XW98_9ARAC|nr:hypothetical protein TNIN_92751 [Trichonephila inaurata madagascariensis]